MHGTIVPNHNDFPAEMFQQVAEKGGDSCGVEGAVNECLKEEVATKGFRRQGQCGDDRDAFACTGELSQNGSTSPFRPRTATEWRKLQSCLVDQYDMGIFGFPFFTIRGQSIFVHDAMRASSRWVARFAGFCSEKWLRCSQRQK